MRICLALAFALGLSGCADVDLFGDHTDTATPPPVAVQSLPAPAEQTATAAPAADQSVAPEAQAPVAAAAAPSANEPPAVTAARAAPAPSAAIDAHCKYLAKLRAGDAAFQGEDPDTQEAVYNGTYRDCVAWDAAHRS
jgi:hypothetical protein